MAKEKVQETVSNWLIKMKLAIRGQKRLIEERNESFEHERNKCSGFQFKLFELL